MQSKPLRSLDSLQNLLSDEEKQKVSTENEKRDKQWKDAQEKIKKCTIKEMNVMFFPAFIRMNYPELRNEKNDVLFALGDEFKKYLKEVFKEDFRKLEKIWDIEIGTIVMNKMRDPFSINGYDPVFILHFGEFCKKMKEEALKQIQEEKI